jgi:four helix bundle protein
MVIETVRKLPQDRVGAHLGGQLLRSGTSPALNYGEAQAAESRKDFIHKMKICLKELRETQCCLQIISKNEMLHDLSVLQEANQLVAIFTSSIKTAEGKNDRSRKAGN